MNTDVLWSFKNHWCTLQVILVNCIRVQNFSSFSSFWAMTVVTQSFAISVNYFVTPLRHIDFNWFVSHPFLNLLISGHHVVLRSFSMLHVVILTTCLTILSGRNHPRLWLLKLNLTRKHLCRLVCIGWRAFKIIIWKRHWFSWLGKIVR